MTRYAARQLVQLVGRNIVILDESTGNEVLVERADVPELVRAMLALMDAPLPEPPKTCESVLPTSLTGRPDIVCVKPLGHAQPHKGGLAQGSLEWTETTS